MSKFDTVTELFDDVRYMRKSQAKILKSLIESTGVRDVLEIGFYQGKSTCYLAAILDDLGEGSVTTFDLESAERHDPNIHTMLEKAGLAHRVSPFFCKRSYTWELQRLITMPGGPRFDFCYFDGGHTWDLTGFGVLLVDMLLRPGGLILMDAMEWSMNKSPHYEANPKLKSRFDADELSARPVRLVWESILPHLGYEHVREYPEQRWALARKPG